MYKKRKIFYQTICAVLVTLLVLAIPIAGFSLSPEPMAYGSSSVSPTGLPWENLPNPVIHRIAKAEDIENSPSIESVSMSSYDIFKGDPKAEIKLKVRPGKNGATISKVTITVAKYDNKGVLVELRGVDSYPIEIPNVFRYTVGNEEGEQCVQEVHNMSIEDADGNVTFYTGKLSPLQQIFKTFDNNTSQLTLDYYDSDLRLLFKLYSQTAGTTPIIPPTLPDDHDGRGYHGHYGILPIEPKYHMFADNFSFINSEESFGYTEKSRIPKERFTNVLGDSYGKYIYRGTRGGKIGGLCFGFNAVNLAFFTGDLNYRLYSPNLHPTNVYAMEAPKNPSHKLTQLLETYQISQHHPDISETLFETNKNDLEGLVKQVQSFQDGKIKTPPIIALVDPGVNGHGVMAYAIKSVGAESLKMYELTVYDCNYPNETDRKIFINLETGAWSYTFNTAHTFSSVSENAYMGYINVEDVIDIVATKFSPRQNAVQFYLPLKSFVTDEHGKNMEDLPGVYQPVSLESNLGSPKSDSRSIVAPVGNYKITSPTGTNKADIFYNGEAYSVSTKGVDSEINISPSTDTLGIKTTEGFELELWNDITADDSVILSTSSNSDVIISQDKTDIIISSNSGSSEITASNSNGSKKFSVSKDKNIKITDKLDITTDVDHPIPQNNNTKPSYSSSHSSRSEGTTKADVSINALVHKEALPSITWLNSSNTKLEKDQTTLCYTGKFGLKKDILKILPEKQFIVDTIEGNSVVVRVNIPKPSLLTDDTVLSATVSGNEVNRIQNIFTKSFKNQMVVISFDNKESWNQDVRVYAKVDLDKMDKDNLKFYSYNSKTNTYKEIVEPNYQIDSNGYLLFTTNVGGEIIISSGELVDR